MTADNHEKALAGGLLFRPQECLAELQGAGLTGGAFINHDCKAVFETATRLAAEGAPLSSAALKLASGLPEVTFEALLEVGCLAGEARYYASKITEAQAFRRAVKMVTDAKGTGLEGLRLALEKIMQTLPTDQSGAGALTASDWLGEPDAPEYPIAAGLIDAGDRVSIVGQSKARKSFFAMQLAVSISTGTPFLPYEIERKRVLMVNGEIRPEPYKKRLRRMIEALQVGTDQLNGLIVVNSCDTENQTLEDVLLLAKKHHAEVVILDPFYLMLGDEIQQAEVKSVVRVMKRFAASGITLVSVFHAAKGRMGDKQVIDRISGSGVFARDATTIISLVEHASEADHTVMQCVTRNHPPQDAVTLAFADGAFSVADDIAAVEKTSQTKAVRAISIEDLAACFRTEPTSYGDTVAAIRQRLGVGRDRAKDEVARAVREGVAHAEQAGRTTLYSIRTDMA